MARPNPGPSTATSTPQLPSDRAIHAHQSLRWRLSLAYVAVLGVLLAALGVYQEVTLRSELIATRVTSLSADLDASRTVLARGVRRSGLPVTEAAVVRALCQTSNAPQRPLVEAFANVVTATSGHAVAIIIFDRRMTVAAASPAASGRPRLDPADVELALDGTRSPPRVVAAPSGDQLLVGFPLTVAGTTCGVAQLSTSMQPIDDAVAGQRVQLLLGAGLGLALALLIGVLLIGGALRPLTRLTRTAGRLAAGDLGARAAAGRRRDEVGILTQTFDHMAERIQESFDAQALAMTALSESEARTRRFIADASHELRTPVTVLKGYIDVIRRGAAHNPATLDSALAAMSGEAERMRTLVVDLLTLARLDAHRPVVTEALDLGQLLGGILDEGVPGMPARITRVFPASPVVVMGDPQAITTVARNLLSNACKYAPGAPQTWTVDQGPGWGRFQVRDEGPGIAAADLPHVFERFYRGEKTRAREEGGSGLGMSIVQGLVHAQGGEVRLESADGLGTTVTVVLPISKGSCHNKRFRGAAQTVEAKEPPST